MANKQSKKEWAHQEKLEAAALEYWKRQNRLSYPKGKTAKGGRWYPGEFEKSDCCAGIRGPSRQYPWSLMHHCRTAKHISNLFGVNKKEMLEAVRVAVMKWEIAKKL